MHRMFQIIKNSLIQLTQLTHSQRISRSLVLTIPILLSACASHVPLAKAPEPEPVPPPVVVVPKVLTPEQDALLKYIALYDRLYRVAGPLLVQNADLCKTHARNLLGFTAKTKYSYSADLVDAAEESLGLNDKLRVMGVLVGSGAAKAGVQHGDTLVSIEGKALPEGQNAERQAAAMLGPLVTGRASIKMVVVRKGDTVDLDVPLTLMCAYNIELGNSEYVNAYADGHRTMLTRGMLAFAHTDREVAYVLAKEMAHNTLGHPQKQRMHATIGGIIDNLIRMHPDMSTMTGMAGIKPMPAEMDAEADTLALYMVARAGYDIDGAPAFWQKLATQYPPTLMNGYNAIHPSTASRLAAIEKTVAEIKAKQASKAPLVP